jgi:hypothetical protein
MQSGEEITTRNCACEEKVVDLPSDAFEWEDDNNADSEAKTV